MGRWKKQQDSGALQGEEPALLSYARLQSLAGDKRTDKGPDAADQNHGNNREVYIRTVVTRKPFLLN